MANFGTMVQRIADEMHRLTTSSAAIDSDAIKREIISTLRDIRYERFWFNESTFTLSLVDGTDEYSTFPSDLLRIDEAVLNFNSNLEPLKRVSLAVLRDMKGHTAHEGYPEYWGWHHERLIVYPVPNQAMTLQADYVQDLGTPTYSHSGGTWSFFESDAATTLQDSFTNAWFTTAEEAVRSGTKVRLLTNYYSEPAMAREQAAEYRAAIIRLREQHDLRTAPYARAPWY